MDAAAKAADNRGVRAARRGHLKVFIGMAAGVGKTYRMLQEGHAELDAGRDVAIGYMEPHRRPETSALAGGLEAVPRRTLPYRGTELEEMDLPALLDRAPELALVDELAGTPTPPAPSTASATKTYATCSPPESTSSPPSTSSTWSR